MLLQPVINRIKNRQSGKVAKDSLSVDLLLTGCEVSLWVLEQFASDLSQVMQHLELCFEICY